MTENKDKSKIEINCAKRAILVREQISACLYTGNQKLQSGFGNGDCVFLDFQNLFFALSDSTDRWPDASRNFLIKLADKLNIDKPPENEKGWLDLINSLYATQKYLYRATFSGIALNINRTDKSAIIVHGGDSIILIVDVEKKEIKYQTDSNMNFIGRAKCIPSAVPVQLDSGSEIIIIGSDGIADIARLSKLTLEEMCIAATSRYSVDDVPHQIAHLLDGEQNSNPYDDVSIIAIDPHKISDITEKPIIMGGTMPEDEKRYASLLNESKIEDAWHTLDDINIPADDYTNTGILIKNNLS